MRNSHAPSVSLRFYNESRCRAPAQHAVGSEDRIEWRAVLSFERAGQLKGIGRPKPFVFTSAEVSTNCLAILALAPLSNHFLRDVAHETVLDRLGLLPMPRHLRAHRRHEICLDHQMNLLVLDQVERVQRFEHSIFKNCFDGQCHGLSLVPIGLQFNTLLSALSSQNALDRAFSSLRSLSSFV